MSSKKIRVAVVGTGGIGKRVHIPAYRLNKNVDLVALVDDDKEKADRVAKKFGVKNVYSSVDELFENVQIDAVSVCTPPDSHADITLKALDHGAHVLCEKPLATDADTGKKMVAASQARGKILMVGFHRRYFPNYQLAKRNILNGKLGHVYCAEDHFVEPNPLFGWGKSQWFFKPGVGGVLYDIAPHVFDMLNYVFDDFPKAISAYGSTYLDSPVEEQCTFLLEYPSRRIGIGIVSWLSPTVMEGLQIYGTAQNLLATPTYFFKASPSSIHEISLLRAAGESLVSLKFPNLSFLNTRRANPYQLEIDDFVERIGKNQNSNSNALNALSVLITCDMAKVSMEKKTRVAIPSPAQA
jgi:predicted dehydrogenase